MNGPQFYSRAEAAAKLRMSQNEVKSLAAEGNLREFRDRGDFFYKGKEVDALAATEGFVSAVARGVDRLAHRKAAGKSGEAFGAMCGLAGQGGIETPKRDVPDNEPFATFPAKHGRDGTIGIQDDTMCHIIPIAKMAAIEELLLRKGVITADELERCYRDHLERFAQFVENNRDHWNPSD